MKPSKSKNLDKHLLNTISYFSFFGYAPSLDEIHTFFPEKIAKNKLRTVLESSIKQKKLISYQYTPSYLSSQPNFLSSRATCLPARQESRDPFVRNDKLGRYNNVSRHSTTNDQRPTTDVLYTLPQYTTHFKNRASRQSICQKKLIPVKCYTGMLEKLPFIQLIGITGSASMGNTTRDADVDLFIVTRRNCLFIGRFFAILLAHIMHVRNDKNGVCLNLFFEERDLAIPLQKQTSYVAHEVLQMKPVVNKDRTYERFLKANEWVKQFYPNVKLAFRSHPRENGDPELYRFRIKSGMTNILVLLLISLELSLKTLQLAIIRRNKTGLIISPTQLWLFKKDFEKKMTTQIS